MYLRRLLELRQEYLQQVYFCTAAVLRAKKCVMKTATTIQENAGDIYAEAKAINEEREAAAEVVDEDDDDLDLDFEEEYVTEESAEAQN